jgi:hypothetical protein
MLKQNTFIVIKVKQKDLKLLQIFSIFQLYEMDQIIKIQTLLSKHISKKYNSMLGC